jgi:hypothetical protein
VGLHTWTLQMYSMFSAVSMKTLEEVVKELQDATD